MDFIEIKCKEDTKLSSSIGVIDNIGSDLILEITLGKFFSRHLGSRDHIHEFGRKSSLTPILLGFK